MNKSKYNRIVLPALFAIAILFTSCYNKEVKIPAHILPKDTMVVLLTEMQLIEASISSGVIKENLNQQALSFYANIFKTHHIIKEQYEESYQFYAEHPAILEEIYDEVLNDMIKMHAEVEQAD